MRIGPVADLDALVLQRTDLEALDPSVNVAVETGRLDLERRRVDTSFLVGVLIVPALGLEDWGKNTGGK